MFRRVNVRRYKAKAAVRGRPIDSISGRETWEKTLAQSVEGVPDNAKGEQFMNIT